MRVKLQWRLLERIQDGLFGITAVSPLGREKMLSPCGIGEKALLVKTMAPAFPRAMPRPGQFLRGPRLRGALREQSFNGLHGGGIKL